MSAVREWVNEAAEGAMTLDGFDDAIIGVGSRINLGPVFVYDREKIIEILMARDGMEYEEADEYVSFNIEGAWVGEGTPVILSRPPTENAS